MDTAATTIQRVWRSYHGTCVDCETILTKKWLVGWGYTSEMRCADCYWERIAFERRQR